MTIFRDQKDDVLVELTLLGNHRAYEELVIRHEKSVIGTAYKITGNKFSAEDASQDAFVSAWINLSALRDAGKFGSWVCSIAKNRARTLVSRYKNTVPDISLDLFDNYDLGEDGDSEDEISALMKGMEVSVRDERLHRELEALSEKIRETVKLHYFEELTVSEIAKTLGVAEGTVKWRLSEGRKQLRKGYGIMEKRYNENESVKDRVMRQVEELKLWRLKSNKTGFEKDYREILGNVEALPESKEKHHALADTLLRGYWWFPGEKKAEVFARIKESAEKGHNDDVMSSIVYEEHDAYGGREKINFIKDVQIPRLEADGYVKSLAYVWFWLGAEYNDIKEDENAISAFEKVLSILTPADVYYANALAAIYVTKRRMERHGVNPEKKYYYHAIGETYRYIDGKLYGWQQPGFRIWNTYPCENEYGPWIFWDITECDSMMYDPEMKPGDAVTSSDGKKNLTYEKSGVTVTTPAGTFENCSVYVSENKDSRFPSYSETVVCPAVGIVKQKYTRYGETSVWELSSFKICGGEGMLPFEKGNRWEYTCTFTDTETMFGEHEDVFEVTECENDLVTVMNYSCFEDIRYKREWNECLSRLRDEYTDGGANDKNIWLLKNVDAILERMDVIAETKREKLHAKVARKVMERIFRTDTDYTPDTAEVNRWNFFDVYDVKKADGKVSFDRHYGYDFQWKNMAKCTAEGERVLYNDLYSIITENTDRIIWNDDWTVGKTWSREFNYYGDGITKTDFTVLPDEDVTTSAGEFKNCRVISLDIKGLEGGLRYRGGVMTCWYAPGVGIVKFARPVNEEIPNVWELTEYRGAGNADEYFPVSDGLFRRYEPVALGEGYHASVEYTFDEDENGVVIFKDAKGTQDREAYDAEAEKRKAEEENK